MFVNLGQMQQSFGRNTTFIKTCSSEPVLFKKYYTMPVACKHHGRRITRRPASYYSVLGETLVTLDGTERTLTHDSVLIATKENPVCLGGVFGGANSEIDENSKNVALEAAYFYPATTRRSGRSVGYRSDAAARFERGIDIEAVKPGLFRAVELLEKYAGAKFEGMVETGVNKLEPIDITLRFAQIKRLLGCEIETEKCLNILEKLGFEILGKNEAACKVRVPSFRAEDVTRECDGGYC